VKRPPAILKVSNKERNSYKKCSQQNSSQILLEVYGADADFTLFKIPIDRVFSIIQDRSWVRR